MKRWPTVPLTRVIRRLVRQQEDSDRYMRLFDRALERGLLADGDYMLKPTRRSGHRHRAR